MDSPDLHRNQYLRGLPQAALKRWAGDQCDYTLGSLSLASRALPGSEVGPTTQQSLKSCEEWVCWVYDSCLHE